jgi:hypothetical protein
MAMAGNGHMRLRPPPTLGEDRRKEPARVPGYQQQIGRWVGMRRPRILGWGGHGPWVLRPLPSLIPQHTGSINRTSRPNILGSCLTVADPKTLKGRLKTGQGIFRAGRTKIYIFMSYLKPDKRTVKRIWAVPRDPPLLLGMAVSESVLLAPGRPIRC